MNNADVNSTHHPRHRPPHAIDSSIDSSIEGAVENKVERRQSANGTSYRNIRLFENPILERLTHVHPMVPILLWGPVVVFLFYRSVTVHELNAAMVGGISAAGLLFWTFAEYVLHRYAFHFEPKSKFGQKMVYMAHGIHHDEPLDPTRLVMPPAPGIILAFLFYGLFRTVLGPVWAEPFLMGFLCGYLCYDYIHFATHHFNPKTGVGRFIKKYHMTHHFVSPDSRYGVSSPLWDYVFGTVEIKKPVTHRSSRA